MGYDSLIGINGAGTVGGRIADIVDSLGFPVWLGKYSANPHDIKTIELQELEERANKHFPMYAASGVSTPIAQRIAAMRIAGFDIKGPITDLDLDGTALVLDATDKVEGRNYNELYHPSNVPFAIQGGGDALLVNGLYFVGAPGTFSADPKNTAAYHDRNAKIVSCNTTCLTTQLGILRGVLQELHPDVLKHITVRMMRRNNDPNNYDIIQEGLNNGFPNGRMIRVKKQADQFVTMEDKPHHIDELEFLLPQVAGRLDTVISKWPVEYFHTLDVSVDFKEPIPEEVIEAYKLALFEYPRVIYTDGPLCHKRTLVAASKAKIPDGDIPFPVIKVRQVHDTRLEIKSLTPQRAITAPSTADYVMMRTQRISWDEAFAEVNRYGSFRGHPFWDIKNSMQDNLRRYPETKNEEASLLEKWVKAFQKAA